MMRQRRLAAVESEALFTNESERADASRRPTPAAARPGCAAAVRPSAAIDAAAKPVYRRPPGPSCGGSASRSPSGGRANGVTFAAAGGRPGRAAPAAGLSNMSAP